MSHISYNLFNKNKIILIPVKCHNNKQVIMQWNKVALFYIAYPTEWQINKSDKTEWSKNIYKTVSQKVFQCEIPVSFIKQILENKACNIDISGTSSWE